MRVSALLLVAAVMTTNVAAQNGGTATSASPAPAPPSSAAPASQNDAELPVSLDRIRKALERPPLFPVQISGSSLPTFTLTP